MITDNRTAAERAPASQDHDAGKFQFGTSTLLLAMAFSGIVIGGFLPIWRAFAPADKASVVPFYGVVSPIWVTSLFIGYALGRKTLTPKLLIAFAICEAIAVGVMMALID
jgi:hypothetical protein